MAHFRIDFEWLTDHVRSLWAEGRYSLAQETLVDTLPLDEIRDIIRGKRKLIQDPDGKKGVDGLVTDDNWKPDLSFCFLGLYPDPSDSTHFRYVDQYGTDGISHAHNICRLVMNSYNYLEKMNFTRELQPYKDDLLVWLGFKEVVGLRQKRRMELKDFEETQQKVERYSQCLVPDFGITSGIDVDAFVKKQVELDSKPTPPPDPTFSIPTGYILPTGKFHPCGWMEHAWLANVLGNSPNFSKEIASKMGWIEITHPLGEPNQLQIFYGDKEPTEAQLGTLAEWQLKYQGEIINPAGEW